MYRLYPVTKYHRDPIMVLYCWPMVLLCMCNFGPVRIPSGPQEDFVKKLFFLVCVSEAQLKSYFVGYMV